MKRIAIAQIAMRWSTRENIEAILRAMDLAHAEGAAICAFSELAVTGFHREIAREAVRERVETAIRFLQERCAELELAIAVGAPTFGAACGIFNSHVLIDEAGRLAAVVSKQGLTGPEATFFAPGVGRPVGTLRQLHCSAVICREIEDLDAVASELPPGAAQLVFVPGALRQDPDRPRSDPPEYVRNLQRLAAATRAFVVHTNWPNALNRPEESIEGGGSTVASPTGEVLFRLPRQAADVGVFNLGETAFDWHAERGVTHPEPDRI